MAGAYRNFARAAGFVFTFFFGFALLQGDLSRILRRHGIAPAAYMPIATAAVLAYILSWVKPYPGGWLLVVTAISIAVLMLSHGQSHLALIHGLPPFLIGLAFVASADRNIA